MAACVVAVVIGAGPAGLMAAEEIAAAGVPVVLVEGKATIGRKFLMAGKSGLNLTKDEPPAAFAAQYAEAGLDAAHIVTTALAALGADTRTTSAGA